MKRNWRCTSYYKSPRSHWIYRIVNMFNGWVYIGQTTKLNPFLRWKEHLGQLNRAEHYNPRMQRDYDNTPESVRELMWVFEPIDAVDSEKEDVEVVEGHVVELPNHLNQLERYWMGYHKAEGFPLYNVVP